MTNLITAKRIQDVKLDGLAIDWEKRDNNIVAITLTDAAGKMVRIGKANLYSDALAVFIPEPPKFADRWVMSGEFAGCHVRRVFDNERDAERTKSDFPLDASLTVEKVSLQVDDGGEPLLADADIPF